MGVNRQVTGWNTAQERHQFIMCQAKQDIKLEWAWKQWEGGEKEREYLVIIIPFVEYKGYDR